ncbi:MAG: serine/threonine-protein kinase [Myxococcales bacterium]
MAHNDDVPPPDDPPFDLAYIKPGTQIGFYTVETRLGAGDFGAVYKVWRDKEAFALKIGIADCDEEGQVDRMPQEASVLLSLRHPNVIGAHATDRWPGRNGPRFLVMDLVEGTALQKWVEGTRPSFAELARVFSKIARALHEIHERHVFHRDIKSENVLIRRRDQEPILLDFGLAKSGAARAMTEPGELVGSWSTQAPERCRWRLSAERRSVPLPYRPQEDLYALGVMLYLALTGEHPSGLKKSERRASMETLHRVVNHEITNPREFFPMMPEALATAVMNLLAKDPARRFANGEAAAVALDKVR